MHRPLPRRGRAGVARRALVVAPCIGVLVAAFPALAGAAGEKGEAASDPATPPAPVDLDSLLRLPSESDPLAQPRAGGETKNHWLERFAEARDELREAEQRLDAAQRELEQLASNSEAWQVAAPGATKTADNSPLSYKLRQEIRRSREEVERTRRELRELETEASLAGVPEEWRRPPRHEDAVPGGS